MIRIITTTSAMTLLASSATAAVTIDDFSTPFSAQGVEIATGNPVEGLLGALFPGVIDLPTSSAEVSPVGAIGDRQTDMTLNPAATNATLGILNDRVSFSNGSGNSQNAFELSYSNLNEDFSALNNGAFQFEVVSSDLDDRPTPVFLPVTIAANGVAQSVDISAEGIYSIPFSAYTGVDFSSITTIDFSFGTASTDGVDISFADMKAVPAPGAAGLLGLAGLAATRRRR